MAAGAPTMKRLFLELGGKSAHIVLDDADFAAVVPAGAFVCIHAGQGCAMLTRLLVPRTRYDESIELLEAGFASISVGDPTDPSTFQGPQISAKQRERVLGYIEKGIEEGARLVLGGGRPADLPKGWFVEPTLFADVDNEMTIAREEIFGPVLVVIPFEDDDDAVRIANDNEYGLLGHGLVRLRGAGPVGRQADPGRHGRRQRRHLLRRRRAVRWLQGQRLRPPGRARGLRAVPRDQDDQRSRSHRGLRHRSSSTEPNHPVAGRSANLTAVSDVGEDTR